MNDLGAVLSVEDLDYMFEKIRRVPLSQYDQQLLLLVRGMSIHAFNSQVNVYFIISLELTYINVAQK